MGTKRKITRSLTIEWFPCFGSAGEPNGQWAVRLVGGNGETMLVSEQYAKKANAKRAAGRLFDLVDPAIGDVVLQEAR